MAGSGTEIHKAESIRPDTDNNFSLFIVLFAAVVFREPNQSPDADQDQEKVDGEKEALAATAAEKEKAKSDSCQTEQTQV